MSVAVLAPTSQQPSDETYMVDVIESAGVLVLQVQVGCATLVTSPVGKSALMTLLGLPRESPAVGFEGARESEQAASLTEVIETSMSQSAWLVLVTLTYPTVVFLPAVKVAKVETRSLGGAAACSSRLHVDIPPTGTIPVAALSRPVVIKYDCASPDPYCTPLVEYPAPGASGQSRSPVRWR